MWNKSCTFFSCFLISSLFDDPTERFVFGTLGLEIVEFVVRHHHVDGFASYCVSGEWEDLRRLIGFKYAVRKFNEESLCASRVFREFLLYLEVLFVFRLWNSSELAEVRRCCTQRLIVLHEVYVTETSMKWVTGRSIGNEMWSSVMRDNSSVLSDEEVGYH